TTGFARLIGYGDDADGFVVLRDEYGGPAGGPPSFKPLVRGSPAEVWFFDQSVVAKPEAAARHASFRTSALARSGVLPRQRDDPGFARILQNRMSDRMFGAAFD